MENTTVVNEELTNPQASDAKTQEGLTDEGSSQPAPGSKTEGELLLKSLKEEREKRKTLEDKLGALEEKINTINPSIPSEEVFSDEGKALQGEIKSLRSELSEVKGELTKKDVLIAHPELKDKWSELEEFRQLPDNKGMNLKTAAKAFLVENGFLEPTRRGLERATGGDRKPAPQGMTNEEIKHLRETNYRKYMDMLKKDQIKFS